MRNKKKIFGLLSILIWLGVIFYFSSRDSSVSTIQTKFVINRLMELAEDSEFFNLIILKLTENHSLVYSIRKLAHIIIFAILQIIVFNAIMYNGKSILKSSIYSIIIVVLYAIFDEVHQYFTPGRSYQLKDVFIDTIGGSIGLIISYLVLLLRFALSKITQKLK